ncbi:hypothetical protein [Paenibacillus puerhi]|nr:hypothetical protein [Paenibacillus puerhi]
MRTTSFASNTMSASQVVSVPELRWSTTEKYVHGYHARSAGANGMEK